MLKKLTRLIKYTKLKNEQQSLSSNENVNEEYGINRRLEDNIIILKKIIGQSMDAKFRELTITLQKETKVCLCYIDSITDPKLITKYIDKLLKMDFQKFKDDITKPNDTLTILRKRILDSYEVQEVTSINKAVNLMLGGHIALFIDGYDMGLTLSAVELQQRKIVDADTEVAIRGSRESFIENLGVNISLLRKIIKNPNLVFEKITVGKQTRTDICIVYLKGIAEEKIINEVRKRLNSIHTDAILESGYLEEFIDDQPFSTFSTIGHSERPDKIASKVLEGKVAIFCNGTPFVLTVPYLFVETFQTREDYNDKALYASVLRLIRLGAFLTTILLAPFYIALETFHQEMIPTTLLFTAAATREGIPFPALVETLIAITTFEVLRESGIKLPRQVGQAVSIVGALVIGEAAVQAGILSEPMVIIAGLTGITGFMIPALGDTVFFYRYVLIVLSGFFGAFGILIGLIIMLGHMCSIKSFGIPYLTPLAPMVKEEFKDSIIRFPMWTMKLRPKFIAGKNIRRQSQDTKPKKLKNSGGSEGS